MGAGLGELDAEEAITGSLGSEGVLRAVCGSAVNDVRFRGWFKALGGTFLPKELLGRPSELPGDGGTPGPGAGEEDSEPALKG